MNSTQRLKCTMSRPALATDFTSPRTLLYLQVTLTVECHLPRPLSVNSDEQVCRGVNWVLNSGDPHGRALAFTRQWEQV